jgi:tetratricopeptide (TPR) repeat protein
MESFRMYATRALLPVAFGLVAAAASFAQSTGAAEGVEGAMAAFKAGEWKKCAEIAGKVSADSKDYLKAQYVLGETLLVMGDAAGAETAFMIVLEKKEKAGPAAVGVGRALMAQQKLGEAEQALTAALKMDAKDPLALMAMGQVHLAMKKTKEAKAELRQAFDLDPKNPLVVRGWCEWLWTENDVAGALKAAQDLTKALPKHPMGPFLEGMALERDNKDQKALEAYEKALQLDPNFLDAHKNLAILCHTRNPTYQDMERTKKSLAHYEKYFELGGKDPELEKIYRTVKKFMDPYLGGDEKGKKGEKGEKK